MSWSEDSLHRWLARRPRPSRLAGSAMHDAAVLHPPGGRLVACADQAIEGQHAEGGVAAQVSGRCCQSFQFTGRGSLLAFATCYYL